MGKENKLNINVKKVEYDGCSFRLIIEDEIELMRKLKEKQAEIIKNMTDNPEDLGPQ